jgi:PhoPQ-activated pathogenicity-related protein
MYRWLTDADTTRSLWWHFFVIIIPDNYDASHPNNGTLWITDGNNDHPDEFPTIENYNMVIASQLAKGTGLITGCLFQIPNEKMLFSSDPEQKNRSEDSIIAFTWAHFLDHPDEPEWLVRLPMVKASLRALDVMTQYASEVLRIPNLDYYCVSGASKRGWVTWDVAAMDYQSGRIAAIAPIVLDAINFVEVEHHQFRSYGGWTFFLGDYYDQNITARFDDPNMNKLQQIEDPYFYRDRLTLPKLIVNSGGDEFQQPDGIIISLFLYLSYLYLYLYLTPLFIAVQTLTIGGQKCLIQNTF